MGRMVENFFRRQEATRDYLSFVLDRVHNLITPMLGKPNGIGRSAYGVVLKYKFESCKSDDFVCLFIEVDDIIDPSDSDRFIGKPTFAVEYGQDGRVDMTMLTIDQHMSLSEATQKAVWCARAIEAASPNDIYADII